MHPISNSGIFFTWYPGLLELVLYAGAVMAAIGILLFLASRIGEKRLRPEKQRPYECGIIPTGPGRFNYPVPFCLVAIFFLIFDVEVAFIFAWAAALEKLGWSGYLKIVIFIVVLLFSLFYVWRKGALDWKKTSG